MIDRSEWARFMTVDLVDGWYVRLRWIRGLRLDAEIATAAVTAIEEVNAGVARPLLVEMAGPSELTRDARLIFMQCRTMLRIALVGDTPVDRMVAHFSLGVGVSEPTAFFTDRADALEWLRTGELPPSSSAPVGLPTVDTRRADDGAGCSGTGSSTSGASGAGPTGAAWSTERRGPATSP